MTRTDNKKRTDRFPYPDWEQLRQLYIDGNDAAPVGPRVKGANWEEHLFGDWWDREHDFRLQIRSIVLAEDTSRYNALSKAIHGARREVLRLADKSLVSLAECELGDVILPQELADVLGLQETAVLKDIEDGQLRNPVIRDEIMHGIRWVIGEVD